MGGGGVALKDQFVERNNNCIFDRWHCMGGWKGYTVPLSVKEKNIFTNIENNVHYN